MTTRQNNIKPLGTFTSPDGHVAPSRQVRTDRNTREMIHDLKNLLTPILGYVELVLHDMPSDDAQYRRIEKIQRAARSAQNLVHHVLNDASAAPAAESLDVNEQIRAFVETLDGIIPDPVRLELDLPPDAGNVLANVQDLRRVLMNLIANACQAMNRGGSLFIQTARLRCAKRPKDAFENKAIPLEVVRISVQDTGCGIPPAAMERIFETGYTTKPGGNGLGMACVQHIVRNYDGWVEIDSIPGAGTAVHVFLPCSRETVTASVAV